MFVAVVQMCCSNMLPFEGERGKKSTCVTVSSQVPPPPPLNLPLKEDKAGFFLGGGGRGAGKLHSYAWRVLPSSLPSFSCSHDDDDGGGGGRKE